ncbi:hypothetical protein GCM10023328_47540 [Modestobacter marinus]|uniref:Uncharacterized protein n=1 Tax=Modestobacter marinus TaxID=477641 RepID=A0ABQ2GCB7_9ACTN|nr:hypothetical protein [Modestobacter marinus]GGL85113.1 hypothetical protein GCM10011589_46930 [Modestobacter marinus]
MTPEPPWGDYSKGRLTDGWAYPLGRSQIEAALREAGAVLDHLTLGLPDLPLRPGVQKVFDVMWLGDARAGYNLGRTGPTDRAIMRWTAVPSAQRAAIAQQLSGGVLAEGCRWAAEAPTKGNVWTSSEHRFLVTHSDGVVRVTQT